MYGNLLEIPQKGSAKKAEDKVYSFDFSTRTYKETAGARLKITEMAFVPTSASKFKQR